MSTKIAKILQFWFEKTNFTSMPKQSLIRKWFMGGQQMDKLVGNLFMEDLQVVLKGGYQHWKLEKDGGLAYIILTDQFPRSCLKHKTHIYDQLAINTTIKILSTPTLYKAYQPMQKHFLLMPFMHSEKIQYQNQFISRWQQVVEECQQNSYSYAKFAIGVTQFANSHLEILEKFGRFPYYNKKLNRQSTAEQEKWLQSWKGF